MVSLKLKKDGKQELITNVKHHGLAHNYHLLNTIAKVATSAAILDTNFFISSCLGEQNGQSLEHWMKLVIIMRKTCNKINVFLLSLFYHIKPVFVVIFL